MNRAAARASEVRRFGEAAKPHCNGMQIQMPTLKDGRVYCRAEVEQYLCKQAGTGDYDVEALAFPRNLETWQTDLMAFRHGEEMLLQYRVFPIADFESQIQDLADVFTHRADHTQRIHTIVEILSDGRPFYPVFLQQNDPQRRIIEGMHRAVAVLRLACPCLPAFLTGYRNWFTPDEPMAGFDKEDEITPATLRDVYAFFLHATRLDNQGIQPALLGGDRLRQCDEALVAKYRGTVIGAVTLAVAKGTPTISTVYVLRECRRKGVAYRLCERALTRFQQAGIAAPVCDVQAAGMDATLRRLAQQRPDLRALLKERLGRAAGG
jgi:GNAT superfamily N-acetyltransferase